MVLKSAALYISIVGMIWSSGFVITNDGLFLGTDSSGHGGQTISTWDSKITTTDPHIPSLYY